MTTIRVTYSVEIDNVDGQAVQPQSYTFVQVKNVGDNPTFYAQETATLTSSLTESMQKTIKVVNGQPRQDSYDTPSGDYVQVAEGRRRHRQ